MWINIDIKNIKDLINVSHISQISIFEMKFSKETIDNLKNDQRVDDDYAEYMKNTKYELYAFDIFGNAYMLHDYCSRELASKALENLYNDLQS